MTDRPTNRIGRPSGSGGGSDDARTQRAYQQGSTAPPTSKIHQGDSNNPTQASPQAWSQDTGEPGYYRESGRYYPGAHYAASPSDAEEIAPKAWFRSAPTYLLVAAAVAVLTAGGGLAYTLTASDHPAPSHPSVQPAPQRGNDAPPAPQAPPPAQEQAPVPTPGAPVSAPDDSSGSAPNFAPAPQQVQPPVEVQAPAPQQQPDPIQPVPNNQQQPDPGQQLPNNPPPNNGQFPENQQHPGHHHPPNGSQNQQNQNVPQNQDGNGNGTQNGPLNQNQTQNGTQNGPQNQKPEPEPEPEPQSQ